MVVWKWYSQLNQKIRYDSLVIGVRRVGPSGETVRHLGLNCLLDTSHWYRRVQTVRSYPTSAEVPWMWSVWFPIKAKNKTRVALTAGIIRYGDSCRIRVEKCGLRNVWFRLTAAASMFFGLGRGLCYAISYKAWKFTERNPVFTLRSVKIFTQRNSENSLNAIHCLRYKAWKFGYTRQMATLDAPKLLVLTNHTKLTLTVTLTLTDTVTVIFFMRISLTLIKRLYRNNKRNFCGGTVAGFVGGPVFSVFRLFTRLLTRIR